MNFLIHETSPYLQQHADNPVDWFAWNERTLALAKDRDKPILLSIGYASCHWCHVMEKESFMDKDVAGYMNNHFINIKVDREERPDLDAYYMEACKAITGQTGWPLHVFLTPDLKPFFAGTYFPEEAGRNTLSWSQALQYVVYNFSENRKAVEAQAEKIVYKISSGRSTDTPTLKHNNVQFSKFEDEWDKEDGGFGKGMKFPNTMALDYLLTLYYYHGDEDVLNHVFRSINGIVRGGIYDQIGGGISRYATDKNWRIPHFEKMLYDNAQFISLLSKIYHFAGRKKHLLTLEQTVQGVERDFKDADGTFYSAIDADYEGVEGRYYTWTQEEIFEVLGPEEGQLFCAYYGVKPEGNWEGENILYQPHDRWDFASSHKLDRKELYDRLEEAGMKLLNRRSERKPPFKDKKRILAWNALMVSAYVHCFEATGDVSYKVKAEDLLQQIQIKFRDEQQNWLRIWNEGTASQNATLSDYANLVRSILDTFRVTQKISYLSKALDLTNEVLNRFNKDEEGFFDFGVDANASVLSGFKDIKDEEIPSGNAIMISVLHELGVVYDITEFITQANGVLEVMRHKIFDDPLMYGAWAKTLLDIEEGVPEIVIMGPVANDFEEEIRTSYIPVKYLMVSEKENEEFGMLKYKDADQTRIYVCENYACKKPYESVEEYRKEFIKRTYSKSNHNRA
jgi:uncharacterized protein YyaL (SSP411 family)